jgi:hypothetical protein
VRKRVRTNGSDDRPARSMPASIVHRLTSLPLDKNPRATSFVCLVCLFLWCLTQTNHGRATERVDQQSTISTPVATFVWDLYRLGMQHRHQRHRLGPTHRLYSETHTRLLVLFMIMLLSRSTTTSTTTTTTTR